MTTLFERKTYGKVPYWVVTIKDATGKIIVRVADIQWSKALRSANEELKEA